MTNNTKVSKDYVKIVKRDYILNVEQRNIGLYDTKIKKWYGNLGMWLQDNYPRVTALDILQVW